MLRKLMVAAFALFLATSSWISLRAANIPLISGTSTPSAAACSEASQEVACLNALINQINTGVAGYYAAVIGPATTNTAVSQTLGSISIPTSTLSVPGQAIHAHCYGLSSSDTVSKTINLSFGSFTVSTGPFGANVANNAWELELLVTAATSTNTVGFGRGSIQAPAATAGNLGGGATTVTPVATNDLIDLLTAPITVKCAASEGGSVASTTMENLYVEQVK